MELAQLVGVVRHLSAQSAALQYLDQALTVVSTLDEQVAERKKALAEIEQSISEKEGLAAKIISAAESRREVVEQELLNSKAHTAKEVEQTIKRGDFAVAKAHADLDIAEKQLESKQNELTKILEATAVATQDLLGIQAEHDRILSAIQELKSKLG